MILYTLTRNRIMCSAIHLSTSFYSHSSVHPHSFIRCNPSVFNTVFVSIQQESNVILVFTSSSHYIKFFGIVSNQCLACIWKMKRIYANEWVRSKLPISAEPTQMIVFETKKGKKINENININRTPSFCNDDTLVYYDIHWMGNGW